MGRRHKKLSARMTTTKKILKRAAPTEITEMEVERGRKIKSGRVFCHWPGAEHGVKVGDWVIVNGGTYPAWLESEGKTVERQMDRGEYWVAQVLELRSGKVVDGVESLLLRVRWCADYTDLDAEWQRKDGKAWREVLNIAANELLLTDMCDWVRSTTILRVRPVDVSTMEPSEEPVHITQLEAHPKAENDLLETCEWAVIRYPMVSLGELDAA